MFDLNPVSMTMNSNEYIIFVFLLLFFLKMLNLPAEVYGAWLFYSVIDTSHEAVLHVTTAAIHETFTKKLTLSMRSGR